MSNMDNMNENEKEMIILAGITKLVDYLVDQSKSETTGEVMSPYEVIYRLVSDFARDGLPDPLKELLHAIRPTDHRQLISAYLSRYERKYLQVSNDDDTVITPEISRLSQLMCESAQQEDRDELLTMLEVLFHALKGINVVDKKSEEYQLAAGIFELNSLQHYTLIFTFSDQYFEMWGGSLNE